MSQQKMQPTSGRIIRWRVDSFNMRVTLPTIAIALIRRLLPIIQVSVLIFTFYLFYGFLQEHVFGRLIMK
jgi:hypothetical protein